MDANVKAEFLHVLQTGTMETEGVLPWSSNYAFLVTVCGDGIELPAVYKPRRGERPLWDFPQGTLSLREHAAFVISENLGWDLVPPTVLRQGDHGPGSVQLFVNHNPNQHYFAIEGDPTFRLALQKMALLDVAINNADRKGGHVIVELDPEAEDDPIFDSTQVWGIDHGICFHEDYKLRTVIWEFAGEMISQRLLADLQSLLHRLKRESSGLPAQLSPLLSGREMTALTNRVARLVAEGVFPEPGPGRHYPWPPV